MLLFSLYLSYCFLIFLLVLVLYNIGICSCADAHDVFLCFQEPSPLYDNNHYHEECLKCNSCGLNLTGPNQKRARRWVHSHSGQHSVVCNRAYTTRSAKLRSIQLDGYVAIIAMCIRNSKFIPSKWQILELKSPRWKNIYDMRDFANYWQAFLPHPLRFSYHFVSVYYHLKERYVNFFRFF